MGSDVVCSAGSDIARASICGTDNRTAHAFFVSAYQVKSLIRYHPRYGIILRHIRCKKHKRRPILFSLRWTYLQRPPRSSKPRFGRELTYRGVHKKCTSANKVSNHQAHQGYAPLVCLAHHIRPRKESLRISGKQEHRCFPPDLETS